jgi:anti-sigma factor RsiW
MTGTSRFCREAQSQLPALVAGEVSGWSMHVVQAHLRRCAHCSAELERQRAVAAGLAALRHSAPLPPSGLLEELLAQAGSPGARERAAVPVRGAISGARPGLSISFLTVGALASTGVGVAIYRTVRHLRTNGS